MTAESHNVEHLRSAIKRKVADHLAKLERLYQQQPTATVLKIKKPSPAHLTVWLLAISEWERIAGRPAIQLVDFNIN